MARPSARAHESAPSPAAAAVVAAWSGAAIFALSLAFFLYAYVIRFGDPAPGAGIVRPALVNLGLFTAFALHHSALARSGTKAWLQRFMPPYLERSLYTIVSSLLFITVCAAWRPVEGTLYELPGVWAAAGYAMQIAGVVLTLRGARAIDVLDLAGVRPMLLAARGAPPRHVPLETRGVYSIVRHPIYLAWTLLVFGTPSMTGTRAVFAIVSTAYLALAIPFEERGLVNTFGHEYETYRRRVRWRMIPGVY
jgi:protein-S-isoprenylcysteine O-methyltransferase Ste14